MEREEAGRCMVAQIRARTKTMMQGPDSSTTNRPSPLIEGKLLVKFACNRDSVKLTSVERKDKSELATIRLEIAVTEAVIEARGFEAGAVPAVIGNAASHPRPQSIGSGC